MESADCRRRASDAHQSVRSYSITAECEPVKEEPERSEYDVSEPELAEGLYAGHEIKDELVMGPELIKVQDVTLSKQSALKPAVGTRAAPECSHTRPVEAPLSIMTQYSSDDAKFANAGEISYSKIWVRNQSALTIRGGVTPGPHICDVCSKQFTEKHQLIRHIKKVHRDNIDDTTDKYICHICKKRLRHPSKLTVHLRVHTREKPFSCDVCKKQFTQRSDLNRHKQLHTGEKPYSCSVCNKQFSRKSDLTRHMHMHTGEKLYSCDVCKKLFRRKEHLTRHLVQVHKREIRIV